MYDFKSDMGKFEAIKPILKTFHMLFSLLLRKPSFRSILSKALQHKRVLTSLVYWHLPVSCVKGSANGDSAL